MISEVLTVEGKGKPVFTITKRLGPKLLLTISYNIPAIIRSDRHHVHFVPISSYKESSTTLSARPLLKFMDDSCLRRATGAVRTGPASM